MSRIPFSVQQLARAIWSYVGGAAGTAADRAVNATFWNGTAVAAPDTAGYPKVTIKSGTGAGELSLTSGKVDVNDKTGFSLTAGSYSVRASSVQRGVATGNSTSVTLTVSSVTMTRAPAQFGGFNQNTNTAMTPQYCAYGQLTAATTYTGTALAEANTLNVAVELPEFF